MKDFITVTRKGQATLPAELRRKLGVPKSGGVLYVRFNKQTNEAIIAKPLSIKELAGSMSRYIRPGTKPLTDVRGFIAKHRKATSEGYE